MAETDQDQKTEEPTGKRLEEARERGQVPISRETTAWVTFLAILITVAWLGPPMAGRLTAGLRPFIEHPEAISLEGNGLQLAIGHALTETGLATGLIFVVLGLSSILGVMLQTGFFASTDLITPKFENLSPMKGLKRLWSMNALVELGKSFGKLVVLGLAAFLTLSPVLIDLPAMLGHSLNDDIAYLHKQAVHLIIVMLMIFLFIAVADLTWQRFNHLKTLRMTKQEVKDEYRQQEGDPMVKSRLRQIRIEKARRRMMAQVPKADVVITNPTHYAIALQYDTAKMAAPTVIAKGIDQVAQRIREVAEEHKITLVSNPPLSRTLYDTVELDQQIPAQHYRAVAEVISYVYKLKKKV